MGSMTKGLVNILLAVVLLLFLAIGIWSLIISIPELDLVVDDKNLEESARSAARQGVVIGSFFVLGSIFLLALLIRRFKCKP
jgi:hypothetical protein